MVEPLQDNFRNKADITNYLYDGRGINVLVEYQVEQYYWQPGKSKGRYGKRHSCSYVKRDNIDYYNE